jgi:phosphate transport system substrate-binding protein
MARSRLRHTLALVLAVLGLSVTLSIPAYADQVQFNMTGSTQMYVLGALLAHQYMTNNSTLLIGTNATSSQFAFDNTCQAATEVGMSDVYIQDIQLLEPGCSAMVGIPVAISATPVVYNLPGSYFNKRESDGFTLKHPVKLTAQVVACIYLGQITHWNDPAIVRLNPGMKLPSAKIRAFNSSEPGGSGFVFNQWLALSDPRWMKAVGDTSLQPAWPAGSVGEPSSGAMVQAIKTTPYSIGFAGFDYAISYALQAAALQNASGYFVTPSLNGLSIAINKALQDGMPDDFRKSFVTVKDPDSTHHAFNPACFEFFLARKDLKSRYGALRSAAVKGFLEWTIDSNGGQKFIEQIEFRKVGKATQQELAHGFIPVPSALRAAIKHTVDSLQA